DRRVGDQGVWRCRGCDRESPGGPGSGPHDSDDPPPGRRPPADCLHPRRCSTPLSGSFSYHTHAGGSLLMARPVPASTTAVSDADRDALYRIMQTRRDIRHFLPTPLPAEVLRRILAMAHCAPSVGFMQPWNFVLITSETLRQQIKALFEARNAHEAASIQDP